MELWESDRRPPDWAWNWPAQRTHEGTEFIGDGELYVGTDLLCDGWNRSRADGPLIVPSSLGRSFGHEIASLSRRDDLFVPCFGFAHQGG